MYIVNRTRSEVTNIENVTHINLDADVISAYLVSGTRRILGSYDTEEQAQDVFRKMLKACFNYEDFTRNVVMCKEGFDSGVYYMPEG